ncbi:MAG: two-component regulator propeller domain-containing protein [candidate division Zixibacteria bacterium]|nr:two-component regulator propeller domain-containing protein [candidate division Zixibacteria bacterium]
MNVKRGVISAGNISWGPEYIALNGTNANNAYTIASICKDSNGYLWVAGRYYNGSNYRVVAARSTNIDDVSTWGAPTTISSTTTSTRVYPVVVPLNSGNVYVVWYRSNVFEGKKYISGTGWEASVTSIANGKTDDMESLHSAVVDGSFNIHLVYIDASGNLQYQKYNGSSWGTLIQIDAATCNTPTISITPSNNKLYLLWTKGNQIYCKGAINPTSSSDWVSETITTQTTAKYGLTSNYSSTTKICWIYTQGTGSPYNVNFDYLSIPVLSVSVSNSTFSFGTNPLNSWMTPQTSVITNDGTVAENFVGRISQFTDGANTWGISSTANGNNIIRAQWSTTSETGPWNDISAYNTDFTIATNVAVNGNVTFYFRIQTPTNTTSYSQYSSTLTVTAQQ